MKRNSKPLYIIMIVLLTTFFIAWIRLRVEVDAGELMESTEQTESTIGEVAPVQPEAPDQFVDANIMVIDADIGMTAEQIAEEEALQR